MVLENVTYIFSFSPIEGSSFIHSSHNSSSAPFREISDYISLKDNTSSSNDIDPRASNIPKLVTVANTLTSTSTCTIYNDLADLDIENKDDMKSPEKPEIVTPF